MSKMSLLEWVGFLIVLIVLLDFFQNGSFKGFTDSKTADKKSVSVKQ